MSDRLLELIRTQGLAPGDRLPVERDLAATLAVSRSTVREAIRSLASRGIVVARQGSGTYVADISPVALAVPLQLAVERSETAIGTLMGVRAMLEAGAAELAATHATPADVRELEELNARIAPLPDGPRRLEADHAFHRRIHELSGNALLVELLDSIWHLARARREAIVATSPVLERSLAAHERIIAAIAAGDAAAARNAMRGHVDELRGWLDAGDGPSQ